MFYVYGYTKENKPKEFISEAVNFDMAIIISNTLICPKIIEKNTGEIFII